MFVEILIPAPFQEQVTYVYIGTQPDHIYPNDIR